MPRPRSSRRAVIPPTRAPSRRTALLIPKSGFIDLLRSRPELALRMLASMAQHLRVVVRLVDDLTLKDIETRLANWLVRRCPRPLTDAPQTIELNRTKRVLAAEMATTSETLSRTLAKFREQKLVRVSGNTITVTSPRGPEALLSKISVRSSRGGFNRRRPSARAAAQSRPGNTE